MSAGDITAGVATIKNAAAPSTASYPVFNDAAPSVTVSFYYISSAPNALRVSASGEVPSIASITASKWQNVPNWKLSSFFYYDPAQSTIVKWGVVENDIAQPPVTLQPGETVRTSAGEPQKPGSVESTTTNNSNTPVTTNAHGSSPAKTPEATNKPASDPQTSETSGKGSKGITTGAIAGTAVGCLVAGALIAGLVFWFCWGKRKSSRPRDYEASSTALMPQEKGFAAQAIPLGARGSATSPASVVLPLPLEDKAIASDTSKISSSIKNHVQSYYHISRVSPGLIDLADIQQMGGKQPISASALSNLLSNPTTREIALRFCIAWVACSRMRPNEDPKTSLLPIELAGCARKITNEPRGTTAQDASMLAQWRVTTAELLQNSYVRQPFTASDSRNSNIQKATLTLDNILRPFADSRMDSGERKRNLEEILKRSALFAFTLFSQPSTWDFDWQEKSSATSGELCIFPALVQVSNENGQPVVPPRSFSEAVIRPMSS